MRKESKNIPFSESSYDWDKSTKIVTKPSSRRRGIDCLGYYSDTDGEIFIDFERERDQLGSTISHEISHQKLGHLDDYGIDYIEERLGKVLDFPYGRGTFGDLGRFSSLENLSIELGELEVRIFQEIKGYVLEKDDTFQVYLEGLIRGVGAKWLKELYIQVAFQSIVNLVKKKILSKVQATKYRRQVRSIAKRFAVNF